MLGVNRCLHYKPTHSFIVRYNAANYMDLRYGSDILNTEPHLSQKQSITTSSVGLETIELSDLIISMDLPSDALARYKYKMIYVGQDPYTMPSEIWISYDNASIYPEITYPDYNYLISAASPCTGNQLKAYKSLEGYIYFIGGRVRSLIISPTRSGSNSDCVVKGKVCNFIRSYKIWWYNKNNLFDIL